VNLACETIKLYCPSTVIQIDIDHERRLYPFDMNSTNVTKFPNYLSREHEDLDYTFYKLLSACNQSVEANKNPWYANQFIDSSCARERKKNERRCILCRGASAKSLRDIVMVSYFAELIGSTQDHNFLSISPYV